VMVDLSYVKDFNGSFLTCLFVGAYII
jgi:hypothetical protein